MKTVLILAFCFFSQAFSQCVSPTDNFISPLCYSIFKTKLNYNDARQFCHNQNNGVPTYLAVIQNGLQANFLASMMDTSISTFWVGLSRASSSDRFMWDDGTVMYWNYFDNRYPKDSNYAGEMTVTGKWRTIDPSTQLEFVCSYNPNGPTGAPATTQFPTTEAGYSTTSSDFEYTTGYPVESTTGYPDYPSTISTTDYPSQSTTGYQFDSTTDYQTGSTTDYQTGSTADYQTGSTTDYQTGSTTDYQTGSTADYEDETTTGSF